MGKHLCRQQCVLVCQGLYACPQVDECKHVLSSSRWMWSKCRCYIDSYSPALQIWVVGVLRSPLLPHKSCLVLAAQHKLSLTRCFASVTLTKQQQFHTVCKFSLALAQYIILTKNYPTNGRSLRAKFTMCTLSFVLFFAVVKTRCENNWKLPAFCSFDKVYRWPAKYCIASQKNVFPRCPPLMPLRLERF